MTKVLTRSCKTGPVGHSVKVVGGERDKAKHFFGKQTIISEVLKLVLQEVVEADSIFRFKRE